MKLDLFNKETTVAENKEAIRLLREADIFTEAQFIVGLDNETPETLEETFQMAWDWQPDLANWSMYTPWPFTPAVPGDQGSGRGLRLLEIQLRHPDHEARRHDAGRASGRGDEELPPLLHAQGAVPLSLARHRASGGATFWAASRPSSRPGWGAPSMTLARPATGGRRPRARSISTSTRPAPSPRRRWPTGRPAPTRPQAQPNGTRLCGADARSVPWNGRREFKMPNGAEVDGLRWRARADAGTGGVGHGRRFRGR